ncbi:MAG: hypothetical protein ACOCW8_03185, partial [bacterium]
GGIYKWYLNKVTDSNGNYIRYFYDSKEDGETWISRIEYGGNENTGDSHACSVEFRYYSMQELELTAGTLPKYIAGNELTRERVLKEIVTKSSSEVYRRYHLDYDINALKTPFLTKVEVQNRDGESLPETVFEWDNVFPETERVPNIEGESMVSGDFTGDGKDNIAKVVHDNNKFRLDILELGNNNSWNVVKQGEIGQFTDIEVSNCGDFNNDGVDDLIINYMVDVPPMASNWGLYIMDGKTQELLDIDIDYEVQGFQYQHITGSFLGDGYINSIIATQSGFYLLGNNEELNDLTLSDGLDLATIEDVFAGDFNGDGKTDVLIRRENDLRIYSLENFDLELKKTINKEIKNCFVGDFNNDKTSDLIIQQEGEPNTIHYFDHFNMMPETELAPTFFVSTGGIDTNPYFSDAFFEYKSDEILSDHINCTKFSKRGRGGILLYRNWQKKYVTKLDNKYSRFSLDPGYTVEEWMSWHPENEIWVETKMEEWITDLENEVNNLENDGYVVNVEKVKDYDIYPYYYYEVTINYSGYNYLQRPLTNEKTWVRQGKSLKGYFPFELKDIFLADFRGTGRNYLTLRGSEENYETMRRVGKFYDISHSQAVKTIRKGMNNNININYGSLISNNGSDALYTKQNNATHPINDYAGGFQVVSSVDMPDGDEQSYYYRGAKVHQTGKGFLGFNKIISKSSTSGFTTENQYSLVDGLNILIPRNKKKRLTSGQTPVKETSKSFSSTSLANNRYTLRLHERKVEDHLNGTVKTEDFEQFDEHGNLKKKTIDYGDGVSITEETSSFVKKGSLFKNKPSDKTVSKHNSSGTEQRTTTFQYDSKGNLTRKIADPDDENKLTTHFKDYNGFGLPETIEKEANGEARTTKIEYTSSGRFIKKKTDESRGKVVHFNYNENTGLLEYKKDQQDRRTSYEYDGFGRQVKTTHPDGTHSV